MDKRVIFAVAGSGKTTYIIDHLAINKRSLIVTYTKTNYLNLQRRILEKFNGNWPENIALMTYFSFLYRFCYKPFLSDTYGGVGICYDLSLIPKYAKLDQRSFYMTKNNYFFSNRLAFFLERCNIITDIQERMVRYFDEFIIDEVQDIAGRDFNFFEKLMDANMDMLFVGDFYQHTFDTSRDGQVNAKLFNDIDAYQKKYAAQGFTIDTNSLNGSWRCSKDICDYVRTNLGIPIFSSRADTDNTSIQYVSDPHKVTMILQDEKIIKLHYRNAALAGKGHKNWGDTKGEDHQDVCVLFNKSTAKARLSGELGNLPPMTKNKLYVAITRATGNVYLIDED